MESVTILSRRQHLDASSLINTLRKQPKAIRRGAFSSVSDLETSIDEFIDTWNENPRPFVWTASVETILNKMQKCRKTLEQIEPGCTKPKHRKKRGLNVKNNV